LFVRAGDPAPNSRVHTVQLRQAAAGGHKRRTSLSTYCTASSCLLTASALKSYHTFFSYRVCVKVLLCLTA
jgi:hypothetical protein